MRWILIFVFIGLAGCKSRSAGSPTVPEIDNSKASSATKDSDPQIDPGLPSPSGFDPVSPSDTDMSVPEKVKPMPDSCVAPANPPPATVPGVIVSHSPKSTGKWVGSPAIVILPNGNYVAAHDLFGPNAASSPTLIFGSEDRGVTWKPLATMEGQTWSNLFINGEALYLMGVTGPYGRVAIRRSLDNGKTWTTPTSDKTGLLSEVGYHTAPTPVAVSNTRIYRSIEDSFGGGGWGPHFRARLMSASVNADLLLKDSWTFTKPLTRNAAWLENSFNGWLEGNAVLAPSGRITNIMRVDPQEVVAAPHLDAATGELVFDPATDIIDFPGGAKKFTIRHDLVSGRYFALTNMVEQNYQTVNPGQVRNTVSLLSSNDLRHWRIDRIVLYHPEIRLHGFQYLDWQFDGDDIVAVSRTAYEDGLGGASDYHNANYLTFHRVANFRKPCMTDDGLIGKWSFDEKQPGNVLDSARSHWAATEGTVARNVPGKKGTAFRFDGISGKVRIHASTAIIPALDDFSIFAFVKTSQMTQGHIFSNNSTQNGRANLAVSDGKLFWFHNGGIALASTKVIADDTWHHVGITRKKETFTAYIDGVAQPLGNSTAPISTQNEWRIGASAMNTFFFKGDIDEVRVYQRALDQGEINAIAR